MAVARYPAEQVAVVVERLAALLAGGGPPADAWARLAAFTEHEPEPRPRRRRAAATVPMEQRLARAVAQGEDPASFLRQDDHEAWRALGALWQLTERTGAPLGASLRQLAAGFRDLGASEREIAVALAGPAATARLVMVLPFIGIALGSVLGFDTFGVLFGGIVGWVLLVAGLLLLLAAWWWNRVLVRRASRHPRTPGFGLDLVATGMSSGNDARQVLTETAHTLRDFQLERSGLERAQPIIELAAAAGVAAGELLRGEAALERRQARTEAAQSAARLGTALMLPLGACILPAFLALGVAPVLIAVLQHSMAK